MVAQRPTAHHWQATGAVAPLFSREFDRESFDLPQATVSPDGHGDLQRIEKTSAPLQNTF
jgi:hypothetical protein